MSDSLYLFFSLMCVFFAARWLRFPGGSRDSLISWASASLGILTRYAGLSLVCVPLTAALVSDRPMRRRLLLAVAGLALSLLAPALWLIRNAVLTGSATNRQWVFVSFSLSWWEATWKIAESWFVPGRVLHFIDSLEAPPGVTLAFGVVIVFGLLLASRTALARQAPAQRLAWVPVLVWIPSHLLGIYLSSLISYPGPDVNSRTLAPVYVATIALVAGVLGVAASGGSRLTRVLAVVIAASLLGFKAYAARDSVTRLLIDGQGYTSAGWSRSETVRALRALDPEVLYSNDTGAAYFFTGKFGYEIPRRYDPVGGEERQEYQAEYCLLRARLGEGTGVLVLFQQVAASPQAPARDDLVEGLGLVVDGPDGAIFEDRTGPPRSCRSTLGWEATRLATHRGGP
jgi:hypothetical protein